MKTIRINKHVELEVSDDTQMFDVKIDNTTKKVVYHSSEYGPITLERIQNLVDKMIRLKLITIFGTSTTEVQINIWNIDENDDLYIETFHTNSDLPDNELFDDYDRTMDYDEFLDM